MIRIYDRYFLILDQEKISRWFQSSADVRTALSVCAVLIVRIERFLWLSSFVPWRMEQFRWLSSFVQWRMEQIFNHPDRSDSLGSLERSPWLFWSLRDTWNDFSDYPHCSMTHGAISLIILIIGPHCFVNCFRPPSLPVRYSEIASTNSQNDLWFHAGGLFHFKNRNSGAGLISPERGDGIVFDHPACQWGTRKLRAPIRRMICDFMQADCSTSRIATVVPGSSRRRLGAGWWRSGIVTNLAPGDVGDWRRAHIQDLKTRRLQPNLPATAAARLETRMWYHMWYHNGCDIICDITCDISHVMSHMISYAIMWYHACDIICDIMVWCGKMNMISHMMNLFVAYDFTCDITVFWVWYHIIVISHCDIIHDIMCDVQLDHMM